MKERYFYIAVPEESFHEAKNTFYEAPSSYLKVYNGDIIQEQNERIEQLEEVIETAISFLKGNELFIKAEQIKKMRDQALGKEE